MKDEAMTKCPDYLTFKVFQNNEYEIYPTGVLMQIIWLHFPECAVN